MNWLRTAAFLAMLIYGAVVIDSLGQRFFDPNCSHNDLQQQGFEFYRINHPDIFQNDIVYRSMRAYLPPLHFALGNLITWPTDNPVLTGHVLMVIQFALICLFLFLSVRLLVGSIPASFAVIWFLHTRPLIMLLAGGLPRGWIGPVLMSYLYAALRGREWGIWTALVLGSLLNPVAAFIAMVAHSLLTFWKFLCSQSRTEFLRTSGVTFIAGALLVSAITYFSIQRDPDLGTMITFREASHMMSFQNIGGRFPILPWPSVWKEFQMFGLQLFFGDWTRASDEIKSAAPFVFGFIILVSALAFVRRRSAFGSAQLWMLGGAITISYTLARMFAFKLYIPDRYLQMPMGLFLIILCTVSVWSACARREADQRVYSAALQPLCLVWLFLGVCQLSGLGLKGTQMFDACYTRRAGLWDFLKTQTPAQAVIAGQPSLLDGVQLFGQRIGYMTTEAAHPFYNRYFAEVKRRIYLSFRAHYATNWQSFYNLVSSAKIDYFAFQASDFTPGSIHRAGYDLPFLDDVRKLSSGPLESYVFSQLPNELDRQRFPFLVYRDQKTAVIDVAALGEFLKRAPQS